MAALEREIAAWGGEYQVAISLSTNPPKNVQDAIRQRYEAAGWTVRFHDSQMDGASVSLS